MSRRVYSVGRFQSINGDCISSIVAMSNNKLSHFTVKTLKGPLYVGCSGGFLASFRMNTCVQLSKSL